MGYGTNKIFRTIENKPVLSKTVDPFLSIEEIEKIVIVVSKREQNRAIEALGPLYDPQLIEFTEGGTRRQESVYRGLNHLAVYKPVYVLIHDAARPWIGTALIRNVLQALPEHKACVPVIPASDALKRVNGTGYIDSHLKRSATMAAQTPQGFLFEDILRAHSMAAHDGNPYIDDTEVFNTYIGKVFTVSGDPANRKITFPHDLAATEVAPQQNA
jgi:2-C-methyl-D-erythritol 4-phosphate cytidylyltransferase